MHVLKKIEYCITRLLINKFISACKCKYKHFHLKKKKNLYRKKANCNLQFVLQSSGYLALGYGGGQLSKSQHYSNVGRIMELCFVYFFPHF